ncbi:MAG: 30S ribosomal protein S20 [Candidatus Saccharibacteria bacterium]|nr:30S ribosomal protein S20 [Candidatus Saccharibacteria bacterium]
MPIIKSAKKAARQTNKRTAQNEQIKKFIKAALKRFKNEPTAENFAKAQSEYDKAAKKGLLKKNTASRRKAKLVRMAKDSGLKMTEKKAETKKPAEKVAVKTETKEKKPTAEKPVKTEAKTKAKKPATKKIAKATKAE